MRRNDEAIEALFHALELDSTFPMAHWALGVAYQQEGMFEEAIAELEQAGGKLPFFRSWLAYAYAVGGQREKAMDLLNELDGLSEKVHLPPTVRALVYAGLGDTEEAIVWLEKGYEARDSELVFLRVFPQFEDLRSDPRVQDLLRRMNLPE